MSRLSNLVYAAISAALGTGCTTTTIANDDGQDRALTPLEKAIQATENVDDDY